MCKSKKNINEKGATGLDLATGMMIFILFTSTIFTLYLQIYKQSSLVKIHEDIMGYIIAICEDIDMEDYESTEDLETYKDEVTQRVHLPTDKYTLSLSKEKYADINTSAEDLVKRIKIKVTYNFDNQEREIQISKIKVKE